MSLKSVLKDVGKVGVKAANVGDLLGVPGLSQLNTAIRIIEKSSAEADLKAAATSLIESAQSTPIVAMGEGEDRVIWYESKRFIMTLAGLGAVIVMYWALPQEVADRLFPWVCGLVGVYTVGDTLRPSTRQ